jgi:hypothetical protein
LKRLSPYPALLVVAIPLAVVELLKLVPLFVLGSGHWITGAIAMLCAYAVSLFVAYWVFKIVKPKLLALPWFARLWGWLAAAGNWGLELMRPSASHRMRGTRPRLPASDGQIR